MLSLIKRWGLKFKGDSTANNFYEIYKTLSINKVQFPDDCNSTYQKYLQTSKQEYATFSGANDYRNDFIGASSQNVEGCDDDLDYVESLKTSLNIGSYNQKYHKFVSFLLNTVENIALLNDIIDNSSPGNVDDSLKDIMGEIRKSNNKIIETIDSDRLKDEKLMEIALGLTEDITRTTNRFDFIRQGGQPEPFLSSFVEKIATGEGNIPMKKRKAKKQKNTNNNVNNANNQQMNNQNMDQKDDSLGIFSNRGNTNRNIHQRQQQPPMMKNTNQYKIPTSSNKIQESHPMDLFEMNEEVYCETPLSFTNIGNKQQIEPAPQTKGATRTVPQNRGMLYQMNNEEQKTSENNQGFNNRGFPNTQQEQQMLEGNNNNFNNRNNQMQFQQNQNRFMGNPPQQANFQNQMNPNMLNKNPPIFPDNRGMNNQLNLEMNKNAPPMQNVPQGNAFDNNQNNNNNNPFGNLNNIPYGICEIPGNQTDEEKMKAIDSLFD